MPKQNDAKRILKEIGMPEQQQSDISAYSLLALLQIKPNDSWDKAENNWIRIHDILSFSNQYYDRKYAENSRETIRKQCMHPFREAAIIEDNGKATNSPNYRYRITEEALNLFKAFNTDSWNIQLQVFKKTHLSLIEKYASKKRMEMMPVRINGKKLEFSPGAHNQLQRAIIEEFAPRFAPNSLCLYVGDTIKKDLIKNNEKLLELGFEITLHDKMPDVVLYREDKNWLYFIEAVTSVGPMNPQRIININAMTASVTAGKVFVTAFPDANTFKKFVSQLAWETEVWLSNAPDHLIHLNGDRFIGPR